MWPADACYDKSMEAFCFYFFLLTRLLIHPSTGELPNIVVSFFWPRQHNNPDDTYNRPSIGYIITLLGLQSGSFRGRIAQDLTGLSTKRDCSPKRPRARSPRDNRCYERPYAAHAKNKQQQRNTATVPSIVPACASQQYRHYSANRH